VWREPSGSRGGPERPAPHLPRAALQLLRARSDRGQLWREASASRGGPEGPPHMCLRPAPSACGPPPTCLRARSDRGSCGARLQPRAGLPISSHRRAPARKFFRTAELRQRTRHAPIDANRRFLRQRSAAPVLDGFLLTFATLPGNSRQGACVANLRFPAVVCPVCLPGKLTRACGDPDGLRQRLHVYGSPVRNQRGRPQAA